MADELNPQKGLSSAGDRFPFVMALTTTFLLGAVFLIVNGPLIVLAVEGKKFCNALGLIASGVAPFWKSALQSSAGVFTGFLFLALSFVVGLLLTPIDRVTTMISAIVWNLVTKVRRGDPTASRTDPFTSAAFTDPEYPALLSWLMAKRDAKLHWEWELFNYYVYWGVFTNVTICIAFCVFLQWPSISYLEALLYGVLFLLFFAFAGPRSDVMARVHKHYQEQYAVYKTQSSAALGQELPDRTDEERLPL